MSEKSPVTEVISSQDGSSHDETHLELKHYTSAEISSSGKWYDKSFGLFGGKMRYSSAMAQVVMLSFVLFMTPGMYNALTGIGASISDVKTSDDANIALNSTFASIGFFGGTICNYIGIRASLVFGGTGYAIYAGSLLCFYHTENKGFVIFAGAWLGICAAVLWAAQGTIIMSYPTEGNKGKAIMVFWVIFNLGAVIGSIIPLASNIENKGSAVSDSTYIAFIVLMCVGVVLATFMLPMSRVWKSDGTRVVAAKHPHWKDELIALVRLLIKEPKIIILFPAFFASNWFYTYQFNNYNAGRFNLRTRSLNSLLYWFSQMWGAILMGFILDMKRFRRSVRAKIGWVFLVVVGMAIWGGGLKFQLGFTREDVTAPEGGTARMAPMDYKDREYIGPMFLYMFYGAFDALYQLFLLWSMGALSNNPKKTALYAGFYKGIQSAGAAVNWAIDSHKASYNTMFATSWALSIGGLLLASPLYLFFIKDHTELEEDNFDGAYENELVSVRSQKEI